MAIVGSLNRAYDIEEGRPWWKVRLTAIGLTVALAVLRPDLVHTDRRGSHNGGAPRVLVWLRRGVRDGHGRFCNGRWHSSSCRSAVGLVYYFAPDAEQDWVWITPVPCLGRCSG